MFKLRTIRRRQHRSEDSHTQLLETQVNGINERGESKPSHAVILKLHQNTMQNIYNLST